MKLTDFDYDLPENFIAQDPVNPRDSSRLMVVGEGGLEHRIFSDLIDYLREGDVLVLNRSRVIKARLLFTADEKSCEIFLLREIEDGTYECLVRPGRLFGKGKQFEINDQLSAEILAVNEDGTRVVKFIGDKDAEEYGEAPFPPYIKHSGASLGDYQTVYAREKGSVASPTAGLHFTPELLDRIEEKGVSVEKILLHVGLGTFLPVKTDRVEDHEMHNEFFEMSEELASRLTAARACGRRIVAVGTTSVRVLETCFRDGRFEAQTGETDIFIYPGYEWKAVDALITNFHLPKSTLIMLVASFLEYKGVSNGVERVLELYEIAKKERYRFYSFGDSMMIS